VVSSYYLLADLGPSPFPYTTTVPDVLSGRAGKLRGSSPPINREWLAQEGTLEWQGSLYVTHCLPAYYTCATSYAEIRDAYQLEHDRILTDMALGGVTGLLLGGMISVVFSYHNGVPRQFFRAICKNRFWLVYQPIVDTSNGRIVAAEVLLRWEDNDGFVLPPDSLVRIAEDRGFVRKLTAMLIRRSLREFATILHRYPDFHLHINVTASDLNSEQFPQILEEARREFGIEAQSVTIEVTESSTANQQQAIQAIRRLRQLGHSVQIDDFGTGYSSLSYLHDLAVDGLKIDQSFTRSIGTKAVTVNILPQILEMAAALNLQVTVEGIETLQQQEYFTASGRKILGQGWLYGHPVAPEEFYRILEANRQNS
jgi:sensor c-di-GMP phosphodiesterase-like protein